MALQTLDLALIIGGSVVVVAAVVLAVCCFLRSRGWQSAGEGRSLLGHKENGDDGHDHSQPLHVNGEPNADWKYGELDFAGVKRVAQWISDVRHSHQKNGGIDPIVEDVVVDSMLLGQQDDIGSPPQGYSPRVSTIGSDDGRKSREVFVSRDPLKR